MALLAGALVLALAEVLRVPAQTIGRVCGDAVAAACVYLGMG